MAGHGIEPNISVTWTDAPNGRHFFRFSPRVRSALGGLTIVMLGASALLRGPEDLQFFVVGVAAAGTVVCFAMLRSAPSSAERATASFTRIGMSVHREGKVQTFGWTLVRFVARRDGSWEFRLRDGRLFVVPESAFDTEQADALSELVGNKGLLDA